MNLVQDEVTVDCLLAEQPMSWNVDDDLNYIFLLGS